MKCFVVRCKDVFDPKKNPHLILGVGEIIRNRKIKKFKIKEVKKNGINNSL